MNNASLYETANKVQRQDAEKILKEFRDVIQWRPDGRDSLLDIGCGSGDVTIDFILSIMPKDFSELVAVDVSEKMIQYANAQHKVPRVRFEIMDISSDFKERYNGKFDHVMSFYCLHWVKDQKRALRNIFDLLAVDGDCLLVYLADSVVYDAYERLSQKEQWAPYMQDINDYTNPYKGSKDPAGEVDGLLKAVGFSEFTVELRKDVFIYEGTETLKRNVKAICPYIARMTPPLQDAFLEDYVKVIGEMHLTEKSPEANDYRYLSPYNLIVAYARK